MKHISSWKFGLCVAASLVAMSFSGCHRAPETEAGHADEHAHGEPAEVKTAQITVFGERHEIFAEHRLVVAGVATKFVTHVTDLKTLEPRREGPVRFQLRLGQEAPLEQVEKAPTRAGIYEAMLTFPKAGEWQVTLAVLSDAGEQRFAFPPVTVYADAHAVEHAEAPEAPEGISFLKEQQWRVRMGTQIAGKRRLVEQLRLPAQVTARPGSLAQVTPPLAGRLLVPPGKAMPMIGDQVAAGQVLAVVQLAYSEIGARLVEAEAEVARTKLALEQAEVVRQRIEKLAKAEAKSGRELQEAEFAVKEAKARQEAALALLAAYRQASINLGGEGDAKGQPTFELRSPIAGTIVAQSGAAVGEYISTDKAVFTVLDATTVFIEAKVPEMNIGRLAASKAATYELPGNAGQFIAITGDGHGRLIFLGLQVDSATRTVPLVYEARNADQQLRVGQSLNLYVETARAEEALAIPQEAIVEEGGRPIAYVQVGGETFQKRDLKLGIQDGNWVQVRAGITAGERVVTKEAYAVKLASMSSAIPSHGHAH